MRAPFIKMHGLGNDFIVLDAREHPLPQVTPDFARALANRRMGIGCDQLVLLEKASSRASDFRMRIFNADGGEVEACGNASRAVALLHGSPARIETGGGIIEVTPQAGGAGVDMGQPRFEWDSIPLAHAMDTAMMPVAWDNLEQPGAVNIGNPHIVFFVEDCDSIELGRIGPEIEQDPLFPERVNVGVATIADRAHIRLRVWERGAGLTRACGTGACAAAVVAARRGLADRKTVVSLPGGELDISWREDGHIIMSGPASESFRGSFEWSDFA